MKGIINRIRGWLWINDDVQHIAEDVQTLSKAYESLTQEVSKLNQDVFGIFHGLPFVAGVLTMTATDAAKLMNPAVERNSLIPLLTAIVLATRQGQSSLQVTGEVDPTVRYLLEKRGFKIEEIQGSGDNKGLFILWT